jgi:hypothetical protein
MGDGLALLVGIVNLIVGIFILTTVIPFIVRLILV